MLASRKNHEARRQFRDKLRGAFSGPPFQIETLSRVFFSMSFFFPAACGSLLTLCSFSRYHFIFELFGCARLAVQRILFADLVSFEFAAIDNCYLRRLSKSLCSW